MTPDTIATRTANRKYFLEQQARAALPRILGAVLSDRASTLMPQDTLRTKISLPEAEITSSTQLAPRDTMTDVWTAHDEEFPFDKATSSALDGE